MRYHAGKARATQRVIGRLRLCALRRAACSPYSQLTTSALVTTRLAEGHQCSADAAAEVTSVPFSWASEIGEPGISATAGAARPTFSSQRPAISILGQRIHHPGQSLLLPHRWLVTLWRRTIIRGASIFGGSMLVSVRRARCALQYSRQ